MIFKGKSAKNKQISQIFNLVQNDKAAKKENAGQACVSNLIDRFMSIFQSLKEIHLH